MFHTPVINDPSTFSGGLTTGMTRSDIGELHRVKGGLIETHHFPRGITATLYAATLRQRGFEFPMRRNVPDAAV